jgi:hypothetical protein
MKQGQKEIQRAPRSMFPQWLEAKFAQRAVLYAREISTNADNLGTKEQ